MIFESHLQWPDRLCPPASFISRGACAVTCSVTVGRRWIFVAVGLVEGQVLLSVQVNDDVWLVRSDGLLLVRRPHHFPGNRCGHGNKTPRYSPPQPPGGDRDNLLRSALVRAEPNERRRYLAGTSRQDRDTTRLVRPSIALNSTAADAGHC
jgi:hypothetical protein